MKKFFTFVLALAAAVTLNAATQVAFDFSDASVFGYTNPEKGQSTQVENGAVLSKDGVTITIAFESGNGFRFFANTNTGVINLRGYVGASFTIAAPEGKKLAAIVADGSNFTTQYLAEGMTGKTWSSEEGVTSLTTKVIKSTVQFNTLTVTLSEDGEVPPTQETVKVDVAGAITAGMALDSAKTSTDVYEVTGYVVNSQPYSAEYGNQIWFMADDAANSGAQEFEAYACTVSEDKVLMQVLDGDKVTLTGNITKYYDKKNQKFTIEIKNGTAIFVSKVDGDHSIDGQSGGGGDTVPPLPEGVISCEDAVKAAANIADPVEEKATVEGGAVKVRGYVTYAYDAKNGKQSAWLSDTKGSKSGVIEGSYLTISEAVAVGDYVELDGTLAKYKKAASGDKPAEIIIEVINGTMAKVGGTPVDPTPAKLDTITVAQALEIGAALADNGVSSTQYVIGGYVSNIETYFSEEYGNETFWIADEKGSRAATNADGAFYVFRGKLTPAEEMWLDAKVYVTCNIKKYVKEGKEPVIENDKTNAPVEVVEKGQEETVEAINVAQAIEIGSKLADQTVSEKRYEITGYVSYIQEAYSNQYGNETFWITDTKGDRTKDNTKAFEVYRGKPNTKAEICLEAKIKIVCKIKNYKGTIENDGMNIEFEVVEAGLAPDTINVKEAIVEIAPLEEGATTQDMYVVKGYIAEVTSPYDTQYGNMNITMTDKFNRLEGDLTAYRAKIDQNDLEGAVAGAYVQVFGYLQKHAENDFQVVNGKIYIAEAPKVDTVAITVAQAIEIAASLEKGEEADVFYAVTGYVAENIESGEGTQSFWMSDSETETEGDLYIDNVKISAPAADHQQVCVYGWVGKDTDGDARILNGDAVIISGEGIEQIVLTEKAQKVVVDGETFVMQKVSEFLVDVKSFL